MAENIISIGRVRVAYYKKKFDFRFLRGTSTRGSGGRHFLIWESGIPPILVGFKSPSPQCSIRQTGTRLRKTRYVREKECDNVGYLAQTEITYTVLASID